MKKMKNEERRMKKGIGILLICTLFAALCTLSCENPFFPDRKIKGPTILELVNEFKEKYTDILDKNVGNVEIDDKKEIEDALNDLKNLPPEAQGLLEDEKDLLEDLLKEVEEQEAEQGKEEIEGNITIIAVSDPAVTDEKLKAEYDGTEIITRYQWRKDGNNVGDNEDEYTPIKGGSYTVTISADGYKRKTSAPIVVFAVYTVTFNKNGGDTEANPAVKTVMEPDATIDELPEEPIRAGYTFIGWNTAENGSGIVFDTSTIVTDNIIVYAQWKTKSITGSKGVELLLMPANSFTMGSPASESGRFNDEKQVSVTLTQDFYMGKYEVTQGQWDAVMEFNFATILGTSAEFGIGDDYPVYYVTWYDALEFCDRLSVMEGFTAVYNLSNIERNENKNIISATVNANFDNNGYRLPTEAQWEFACRAGTTTAFNWGTNQISSDQANFNASGNLYNGSPVGEYPEKTVIVGSYPANAWGLHDMHGNLYEWCYDSWNGSANIGGVDPVVTSGTSRVVRGGNWFCYGQYLRSACRGSNIPSYRDGSYGFRVIRFIE